MTEIKRFFETTTYEVISDDGWIIDRLSCIIHKFCCRMENFECIKYILEQGCHQVQIIQQLTTEVDKANLIEFTAEFSSFCEWMIRFFLDQGQEKLTPSVYHLCSSIIQTMPHLLSVIDDHSFMSTVDLIHAFRPSSSSFFDTIEARFYVGKLLRQKTRKNVREYDFILYEREPATIDTITMLLIANLPDEQPYRSLSKTQKHVSIYQKIVSVLHSRGIGPGNEILKNVLTQRKIVFHACLEWNTTLLRVLRDDLYIHLPDYIPSDFFNEHILSKLWPLTDNQKEMIYFLHNSGVAIPCQKSLSQARDWYKEKIYTFALINLKRHQPYGPVEDDVIYTIAKFL